MKKESVDFNHIPARHDAINLRLEHWAQWVRPRPQAWKTQPMFRQYRSHAWQWHMPEIKIEINTLEAHETEKAVGVLPPKNRDAIRWNYVFCWIPPNAICRELAVTRDGLLLLVSNGRDMLQNRLRTRLLDSHAESL